MSIQPEGHLILADQAVLDDYFIQDNSDASGTVSFVTNPDSSRVLQAPKVLRLSSGTTNNAASIAMRVRQLKHGGDRSGSTDNDWKRSIFQDDEGTYVIRFFWRYNFTGSFNSLGSENYRLANAYENNTDRVNKTWAMRFEVTNTGSKHHRIRLPNASGTQVFDGSFNASKLTWYESEIRYQPDSGSGDGVLMHRYRTPGGSWTTDINVTDHTDSTDWQWFELTTRPNNAGLLGTCTTEFESMGRFWEESIDDFLDDHDRGQYNQVLDTTSTTLKVRVYAPSWLIDDSNANAGVRLQYGTSSGSLTSNTTYVGKATKDGDWYQLEITGLSADTRYYIKPRFTTDTTSPTTTYEPEQEIEGTTLATSAGTRKYHAWSCKYERGSAGNNEAVSYLYAQHAPVRGFGTGDGFYDTYQTDLASGNPDKVDWDMNAAQYESAHRRMLNEHHFRKLYRTAPLHKLPDDHEFINDYLSTYRTDSSGDFTSHSHVSSGTNTVKRNVGWGIAFDEWNNAIGEGTVGAADAANRLYYRSFVDGVTLHIMLDTRYYAGASGILGATQLAWCKNLINTTTAEYIIIHSPAEWSNICSNTGLQENWGSNANTRAERQEITRYIEDSAAASVKTVHVVCGDRHTGTYLSRMWDGAYSSTNPSSKLGYVINASPIMASRWYQDSVFAALAAEPRVISFFDARTFATTDGVIRTSGVYLEIDEVASRMSVRSYLEDGTAIINSSNLNISGRSPKGGNASRAAALLALRAARRRREEEDE